MGGALEGLRVLDGSQMMAGPLCCMRLGDLGAEVLKIEPPGTGDWVRTHGFANAAIKGETTALLGLNRSKKSVTLNLKNPEGVKTLYELVKISDVFIQNYRVGTAERLGAGYEQLREVNPRIVYCSISGYGEQGPYRMRPGQDLVIQGYSGSMWSVGSKHDLPMPGALWAADAMAAYQAGIGILAALWARQRTGEGQKVEVNMLGVTMDAQTQELTTYLNLGILPERSEESSAHAWIPAPYGVYKTADGFIVLAMAPTHVLGEALDSDRLRELTDWSDGVTHRDEIYAIARSILPTKTSSEWIDIFDKHNIWTGPVYNYEDLANDPHIKETGMITSVQHPTIGELRMPNVPMKLSGTPAEVELPPPLLGEHTDAVLRELLGYEEDRLAQLHATGAI
jgi:crotonobetainyl-CoA:carnitine CoA-transferase CaiB-like acyl-CoA transferase